MRRFAIYLLAFSVLPAAVAQLQAPQVVEVSNDGHCNEVRPGDTVHYSLTIEGVENARAVFADLQMRPAKEVLFAAPGLPVPDFRTLGGGGSARPDPSQPNMFQFSFVVPKEIYGGRYRATGVMVRADDPDLPGAAPDRIDVSHHASRQVRAFCLAVVSNFGERPVRPEVTGFQPGETVPK